MKANSNFLRLENDTEKMEYSHTTPTFFISVLLDSNETNYFTSLISLAYRPVSGNDALAISRNNSLKIGCHYLTKLVYCLSIVIVMRLFEMFFSLKKLITIC